MKKVIVETKGKGTRTIQVGVNKEKRRRRKKSMEKRMVLSFVGIVCSPRIIPQPGSDFETRCISKSWKTLKKGEPKPKKGWQRHGETKRHKYGRVRCYYYPSTRILNELGRCIYPKICC